MFVSNTISHDQVMDCVSEFRDRVGPRAATPAIRLETPERGMKAWLKSLFGAHSSSYRYIRDPEKIHTEDLSGVGSAVVVGLDRAGVPLEVTAIGSAGSRPQVWSGAQTEALPSVPEHTKPPPVAEIPETSQPDPADRWWGTMKQSIPPHFNTISAGTTVKTGTRNMGTVDLGAPAPKVADFNNGGVIKRLAPETRIYSRHAEGQMGEVDPFAQPLLAA